MSENEYTFIKAPERSEWQCYMFGNTPQTNCGITYRPTKGGEPNWFVRWMMKICFACTWVKDKNK
jgi:hypothetical protein